MRFLFLKPIVTKLMANYKKYNNNSTYLTINFLFYYFSNSLPLIKNPFIMSKNNELTTFLLHNPFISLPQNVAFLQYFGFCQP